MNAPKLSSNNYAQFKTRKDIFVAEGIIHNKHLPNQNGHYRIQHILMLILWLLSIWSAQISSLKHINNVIKMEKYNLESVRRNLASDRSSSDFENCLCDITTLSWDINCCCDTECSISLIQKCSWKLKCPPESWGGHFLTCLLRKCSWK